MSIILTYGKNGRVIKVDIITKERVPKSVMNHLLNRLCLLKVTFDTFDMDHEIANKDFYFRYMWRVKKSMILNPPTQLL